MQLYYAYFNYNKNVFLLTPACLSAFKIGASNTICNMKLSLLQDRVSPSPQPEKETVVHKRGSNQEILNIIFPPKYVSAAYW